MQIREYIRHFIHSCIICVMTTLSVAPLSAQEKVDTLHLKSTAPILLSDSATIIPDSLKTPSDSISQDTTPPKPLFSDIITYRSDDSVRLSVSNKKVYLYGNAFVKYLKTELTAQYIVLDMEKNEAFASGLPDTSGTIIGKPKFKDGGQEFDCLELKYNFKSGKGFVKEIITQEGDGYIQGKLTKKMSDSVFCVKTGWYTTCDQHDHPHFFIKMNRAKMIKDKKVISGGAMLYIEDVPLPLYLPFALFPISKKATSGIIMPTYGEERMRGFNLRNGGYYWAICQYIDLAVTGDIYTNGSWALGLQSSYRKKYKYSGNFYFSTSKNFNGDKEDPDYSESSDWSLRWTHTQDAKANPYSTFSVSLDLSSANNNYYNSTDLNEIANQRKSSSITWSKKWPDSPFSLTAGFTHNQNSRDSTISVSVPNATFRMSQIYPLRKKDKVGKMAWYDNIGVSYTAELKNSINTKESELMQSSFLTDWKNGFKHSIPLSTQINLIKDVSLSPSLTYDGMLYLSSTQKDWVKDSVNLPGRVETEQVAGLKYLHNLSASVSLGYNPTIYGMYTFKPDHRIHAIRHVIRPSISASYTPALQLPNPDANAYYIDDDGNQQQYSIFENGIFGALGSNKEQSGSMQLSLDNNLEMKVRNDSDTTGKEEFKKVKIFESVRFSTSYDFFRDSMNWSNISISARTKLFKDKLDLTISGTLDPYALNANAQKINKYNGGIGRLTNASVGLNTNFSSDNGKNKAEKNELVGGMYDQYMDFDVPWSFSCSYNLTYSKTYSRSPEPNAKKPISKGNLAHNFRLNGDFSLTPKWKVGFSTGYDFTSNEVTATNFSISRDLHCWEMTFSCLPFGTHQSYNFQINVRSSLLKDLKLTKKESWFDRR